jgi:hypothetical protein
MLSHESLAPMLYALALRRPQEAANIVLVSTDLDEELRVVLLDLINAHPEPSECARRLGDELRARGHERALVNECYRIAFYTGTDWRDMSRNPLFAYFSANRAGTPLDKWIHYFPIYTRHLDEYRGRPVRVLEIGVYRGGGLDLLRHYLGPDATLVGLDVDDAARQSVEGRFVVELGDQRDPDVLRAISERHGPFDVVVDDGGHTMDQQIVTAETLFPLLAEGGTYIVEDCHTSYWTKDAPEYASDDPDAGTFMDWVKQRVDDVNAYHFSRERDVGMPWATHVTGLHVYDSVVVLEKARRFAPFSEVSGVPAFLSQARGMSSQALSLMAAQEPGNEGGSQVARLLAVRDAALARSEAAELRSAKALTDAAELEGELAGLKSHLHLIETLEEQLRLMRASRSWRWTAPLRWFSGERRGA